MIRAKTLTLQRITEDKKLMTKLPSQDNYEYYLQKCNKDETV